MFFYSTSLDVIVVFVLMPFAVTGITPAPATIVSLVVFVPQFIQVKSTCICNGALYVLLMFKIYEAFNNLYILLLDFLVIFLQLPYVFFVGFFCICFTLEKVICFGIVLCFCSFFRRNLRFIYRIFLETFEVKLKRFARYYFRQHYGLKNTLFFPIRGS